MSMHEGFDDSCVFLGTLKVDQSGVISYLNNVVGLP